MTWNILAQQWYEDGHFTYSKVIPWLTRLKTIVHKIKGLNCDIVCLQEVDLSTGKTDFADLMTDYDFVIHEINKKRNSPIGNMILWRRSEFDLLGSDLRSYAIHVILQHTKTNTEMWFSNVHLKAGLTSGETQRLSQFESCLSAWKKTLFRACICGDFNDDLKNDSLLVKAVKNLNSELQKDGLPEKTFSCNVGPPSCKAGPTLFPFDHAITSDFLMEYQFNKERDGSIEIPSKGMPSDHHPVRFTLKL